MAQTTTGNEESGRTTADASRMTIGEHLEELRKRIIRSLLGVAVGFGLALWKIEAVVAFMRRPLDAAIGQFPPGAVRLVQTKMYGGFMGSVKVAFFAGCVLAAPLILVQIWAFVGAGLYSHERRTIKWYAGPGFVLFFLGVWMAYSYVMPFAMSFLIGWSMDLGVESVLEFSAYISLVAFGMFIFGMLFQLPVVMVFLMRIGMVEAATFRRYRRHAIVANFVIAMLLTPPDVISQIALAGSMIVLYEAAILVGTTIAKPRDTTRS